MASIIYKDTEDEIWHKAYDFAYELFSETGASCSRASERATFVADTAILQEKPSHEDFN